MDVIEKAKILLGISEIDITSDSVLSLLQDMVESELSMYIDLSMVPTLLIAQMVAYRFQTRGTEPLISADYTSSKETYLKEYPTYIQRQLERLESSGKRLKTL